MFESDLFTFLTGNAGLSALVSARVYPTKKPPAKLDNLSYPCVTYFRVSGTRDHTHDGVDGLRFPRFQFNCWAKKYLDAKAVAAALSSALDNYRGRMGSTRVDAAFVEDEADILDPGLGVGTDLPLGVRVDVKFTHAP